MTKGARANTRRQESNRWTIQLNSKSVITDDEVRDDQRRVVWYDSIGTAAPAAPVLVGAHQAAILEYRYAS